MWGEESATHSRCQICKSTMVLIASMHSHLHVLQAVRPSARIRMQRPNAKRSLLLAATAALYTCLLAPLAAALPEDALLIPGSVPLDTDGNLVSPAQPSCHSPSRTAFLRAVA